MIIDKQIPIPLYYQLKQIILNDIAEGVYKEGDMIPTEMELIDHYDVSRTTVRQAINDLVNEGYLTRKKGVGTFIKLPSVEPTKRDDFNIPYLIEKNGYVLKTELFGLSKTKPSKQISDFLKMDAEDIFVMERLRSGNDIPISFSRTHIACSLVPTLEDDIDEAYVAWHKYLKKKEREVFIIDRTLEVGLADKTTSEVLSIPVKNSPIMIQVDLCYGEGEVPLEYTISTININALKLTTRYELK